MYVKEVFAIVAIVVVVSTESLFTQRPDLISGEPGFVKTYCEDDTAALVTFHDKIVDQTEVPYHTQQFHLLIQKIAKNYTKIVMCSQTFWMKRFQVSLVNIFLKVVAEENRIRKKKELQPFQVFLHIPVKFLQDQTTCPEIKFMNLDPIKYIGIDDTVSGVIFQTYFINTCDNAEICLYGKEMSITSCVNFEKVKKVLKSLRSRFGYNLKIGLAVNSYQECINLMVSGLSQVVASFDVVVLNGSFIDNYGPDHSEKDMNSYSRDCTKMFQESFDELSIYRVEEVFNFNG